MSNPACDTCGSVMLRFENPDRWVCPTPQNHNVARGIGQTRKGAGFPKGAKRQGPRGKKK